MRTLGLAALTLAFVPGSALAQSAAPGSGTDIEQGRVPAGPAGRTENFVQGTAFDYEISEDSSSASVQVGGYSTHTLQTGADTRKVDQSWSLSLAVPIGGASDLTSSSMLDALGNGTKLSFAWSRFGFRGAGAGTHSPAFGTVMKDAVKACKASIDPRIDMAVAAAATAARAAFEQFGDAAAVRTAALAAAGKNATAAPSILPEGIAELVIGVIRATLPETADRAALAAAIASLEQGAAAQIRADVASATVPYPVLGRVPLVGRDCNDLAIGGAPFEDPDFAKRYLPAGKVNGAYRAAMWRYGLEAGVGLARFDFVDAALVKHDPSKPQFEAALFGALYPGDGLRAVLLRAEYQNAFEAVDDALVCKTVVVDPSADCVTGAPTPPKHIERVNLSAEYRQVFELSRGPGNLAISPKATYDTLTNEFAAQFPVYFIPHKAGKFLPGATLTYSSKTDRLSFGVFMRTSF